MKDSVLVICNSAAMVGMAGAMIVDTMILLNPVAESASVTVHFKVVLQSFGLSRRLARIRSRNECCHDAHLSESNG